ncbi:hypothetical protein IGI46_001828 [Enterococcus sp. AZ163]
MLARFFSYFVFTTLFFMNTYLLHSTFLEVKPSGRKRKSWFFLYLCTFLMMYINAQINLIDEVYPRIILLFLLLCSYYSIFSLFFCGAWYRKLFLCFLMQFLFTLTESVLWLILISIKSTEEIAKLLQTDWYSGELALFLILLIVFLMNRKSKKHHSLPAHVAFLYIAIVLVCFTISSYVLFSTDKFLVSSHMILLIMYYFSFKVIEKVHEQNYQHQLNEKKLVLENQYYQKVEQHQEEVRMLKHDMKNQLLGIQAYYQEQQYEKLEELLATLVQKSENYEKTFFTSNKLVNLIVADKIGLAKEKGIDYSVEIVIPSELAIADNDLINVLSNILDNAIEACGYCEDGAFIFLEVFLKRHCLFVQCKNSTDGLHHSLDTRKNSGNHGLGLKSMRAVADNYNGELTYKWEDKQFSIEVLLFEDHI